MTQPVRVKTPAMVWVVLMLLIVLAATFAFWTSHDQSYLAHRRAISDAKNGVTAAEQTVTRNAVCTALEKFPQNAFVRGLEAKPYPIYGKPTEPFCSVSAH